MQATILPFQNQAQAQNARYRSLAHGEVRTVSIREAIHHAKNARSIAFYGVLHMPSGDPALAPLSDLTSFLVDVSRRRALSVLRRIRKTKGNKVLCRLSSSWGDLVIGY